MIRVALMLQLFFLISSDCYTQYYYSENFKTEQGLPTNSCRKLFIDSRNILWIGTDAGVCSYDGEAFHILDNAELLGSKIWAIAEDSSHNIWFGTYGNGAFKYDGIKIKRYTIDDGLPSNKIRSVKYFPEHNLLCIGGEEGFSTFDGENMKPIHLPSDPETVKVLDFIDYNHLILVFQYNDTIFSYDPVKGTVHKFSASNVPFSGNACSVLKINDNSFAQSTGRDGFKVFDSENAQEFNKTGQIFGIDMDNNQNIWFASWVDRIHMGAKGGLYRYYRDTIQHFNPFMGIDDCIGWDVLFDRKNNNLWFSTLDQGLFRIPLTLFENLKPAFFNLKSLHVNDIYFEEKHDALWIASVDNIIRIKRNNYEIYPKEKFITLNINKIRKSFDDRFKSLIENDPHWYEYDTINKRFNYPFSIFSDDRNLLKSKNFSTLRSEIFSSDYIRKKIKEFNGFDCISEDSKGEIYISSKFGFYHFDSAMNIHTPLIDIPFGEFIFTPENELISCHTWSSRPYFYKNLNINDQGSYLNKAVTYPRYCNKIIANGEDIWYGCIYDGLYWGRENHFVHLNEIDSSLCNTINDICFDNYRNTIVGANDGEIYILTFNGDELNIKHRLGEKNGIVGNSIKWLIAEQEKYLWIGTDKGLNRLDLDNLYTTGVCKINFYNAEDGFLDYSGRNPAITKEGVIWLGTDNGIIKIDSKKLSNTVYTSNQIILKEVLLFNKSYAWDSITEINPWTKTPVSDFKLTHNQNYLTFYFGNNNLSGTGKDLFSYKLEGADKNWSEYSAEGIASYAHLEPGFYTFKVRSRNLSSNEDSLPFEISFQIHNPWWQTWWFYLIIMLVILTLIHFYTKRKVRFAREKETQKAEINRQLAELKIQALQAQMNPHFTFNALNSIQGYIIDNKVNEALGFLSDFSKMLRQTLDNTSLKYIPLSEEIEYLNRYLNLEKMRFEDQLETEMTVDDDLDPETILIPPMILQPFIENAIKHGLLQKNGIGKLKISIHKKNEENFICSIEDNGIGRKKSEQLNKGIKYHNSKGIKLTHERINLLNKTIKNANGKFYYTDLYDEHGNPSGTMVTFELPLLY